MLLLMDVDPTTRLDQPVVGVGGIAIEGTRLLLIQRSRPPFAGRWSLPGGKLHSGETLEQALRREMREETGLDVEVTGYAGILESIFPEGSPNHYIILDYYVKVLGGEMEAADDASDARWLDLSAIRDISTTPRLIESLENFGVL